MTGLSFPDEGCDRASIIIMAVLYCMSCRGAAMMLSKGPVGVLDDSTLTLLPLGKSNLNLNLRWTI
jgi:hypothetical protein